MYVFATKLTFICLFIDYSRWHPPWEFRIVCDEACITLVVSRAVLMFLGLLIAFLIKKHFPDMDMSI